MLGAMRDVVIVDAVRSPVGRRNGELSTMHSAALLSDGARASLIDRTGVDPGPRSARWSVAVSARSACSPSTSPAPPGSLADLPIEVAATTVDAQCGSSQQATNLAFGLIQAGVVDSAVSCGVEVMSRIPMGAAMSDRTFGRPVPKSYCDKYEFTSQFEGAERIADQWGISRDDSDGSASAASSSAPGPGPKIGSPPRSLPVDAPNVDDDGKPDGTTHRVERDGGLRDTTLEALAGLKTVARKTACTPPARRRRSPTAPERSC